MTKKVKAEKEKIGTIDSARAPETERIKRSKIKEAEKHKNSDILHPEGDAEVIKLVSEAADQYFIGNVQLLRKLDTLEYPLD